MVEQSKPAYLSIGPSKRALVARIAPSDGPSKVMVSGQRAAARFMLSRELWGVRHDSLLRETFYRLDSAAQQPWPATGVNILAMLKSSGLEITYDQAAVERLGILMSTIQARYSRWVPIEDEEGEIVGWDFDDGGIDPAQIERARQDLTYLGWGDYLFDFAFEDACEILTKRDVMLSNPMGTGKSRLALALAETWKYREGSTTPTIIVAQRKHLDAWEEELGGVPEKEPCELLMLTHGLEPYEKWVESKDRPRFDKPFLLVSLERLTLMKDADRERLAELAQTSTVIVDEAYSIQNKLAKRSQKLMTVQAAHHISITGTPIRNYVTGLCFSSGTRVTMADMSTKPIEAVQPGEWVLSRSRPGTFVAREVLGTKANPLDGREMLELHIETQDGYLRTLRLTAEHEILTANRGWVQAQHLTESDEIEEGHLAS